MDGSRIALVVANDQYDDPGLRRLIAPAQDAAVLADVLADPSVGGFEVQVLHNESAQQIRFAVEDFFADRAPEDLLLLHFSCHGLKNAAGELFLAVADTKPNRLASTAVAADFVNRQMADSRAQRIALFLDCCYGGAFPRGMVVRAAGEAQVRDAFAGQEEVGGGRGRVVVTASSAMEYAFEGDQLATDATKPSPSVFTSAVVDGLSTGEADRDGDGWVGLTELVGYVTDRVHRVTPNQNPQMWTFGSQGELLIARSRVRRITPAPLAPELVEAMESPLPPARFGVVDYLRGKLYDADLGQAYGAWQALHRLVDDDSRKVSEAAVRAISEAVPRVTPASLELGPGAVAAELRLEGPPIALTAVASSEADWVRVEQDGATVRVSSELRDLGEHEASVVIAGPTGECVVPVQLTVPDTDSEPPPPPPEPEPQPKPAPPLPVPEPEPKSQTEPVAQPAAQPIPEPAAQPQPVAQPRAQPVPEPSAQPQPAPKHEPAQPARTSVPTPVGQVPAKTPVPWWAVGVLALGALVLIYLNWPGEAYSHKLWYDPNTDWRVYRSATDPMILSSIGALLASLLARWAGPIALGVVAGCAASVLEDAVLVLGARIVEGGSGTWLMTLVVAAVMVAVLLIVLWPENWRLWPVSPPAVVLVVAGGILLLISAFIKHPDDFAFIDVTKLAVLEPLVIVAMAWLALAAAESRSIAWLSATVATYAVLSTIAAVPALTDGDSPATFLTALLANALVAAGVLTRVLRPQSHP
ncbi:caspase domain-containing protein [Kribbella antiqua]|uniref:Caspase domain-containing protein n=1 Tax=Kribbella antiqua TaxID=2512217 RepID=A0A4R2I720_9ACTN|nr:caspase family protein [Kribbella antiqua]TCO40113.1 caspase domain-containing protein [Kribbella antiqua]